jgi:hypothetical protein
VFPRVLPRGSRSLLAEVERRTPAALRGWTLAGGTGLALQLGHRLSDDFDFFKSSRFQRQALQAALRRLGKNEVLQEEAGTLTVLLRGIKLSFFRAQEPFLFEAEPFSFFRLSDLRDIALMKMIAVMNRGSRKDFVDLYCLLRRGGSLADYIDLLPKKYGAGRVNPYQLLQSLIWFEEAEKEPSPRMLEPFDWKECKAFFLREARGLVLPS